MEKPDAFCLIPSRNISWRNAARCGLGACPRRAATTGRDHRNTSSLGGVRGDGEGTSADASAGADHGRAKRRDRTGRDRCAGILQGPDVALYRLALPASGRQSGAGLASDGCCTGDGRGGNAGARRQPGKHCQQPAASRRALHGHERAAARHSAEPNGNAGTSNRVRVSSPRIERRTGHRILSRHQRLHARR